MEQLIVAWLEQLFQQSPTVGVLAVILWGLRADLKDCIQASEDSQREMLEIIKSVIKDG